MITLPLPPTLNHIYGMARGRVYKKKKAKDWENEAFVLIKKQWKEKTITGQCYVGVRLYYKRDRDIDSSFKLLLDILEDAGVYKNDKQVKHLNIIKHINKKDPRMEIDIEILP